MTEDKLDLKTATLEQLQAFGYRCLAAIEQNNNNLKAINAEIVLRANEAPKE